MSNCVKAVGRDIFNADKPKKHKRCKYSNIFYVYDIESTKYEDGEVPIMAYSYLHGIKAYTFNSEMNKDNLYNYAHDYKSFRFNDEVWSYFYNVHLNAVDRNEKVLVLAHNLTYEFYNAIFNMPKLHEYLTNNPDNIFAISSTDILYIRIGNLEFRDTLKLFSKSLKLCAETVGMKKNEENKTYNEVWTPKSRLPEWEYSYNEHDLDITAVYFAKFVSLLRLKDDTINEFCKTKILTSTGMVKWTCSKINTADAIKTQMLMVKECQQSINELIQDWIERYVFRGGFCKSIAYYSFRINKYVWSIDFASSYPAVMVTASFPSGKIIECKGKVRKLYNKIYKWSDKDYIKEYFNESVYEPEEHFIFKAKLTNVVLKERINNNDVPYISKDKCSDIVNGFVCNGSVYKADMVEVSGTELDLILYCMYYNFNIGEVIQEFAFEDSGYLQDYKILSIAKFAVEKEGFKKLNNCETIEEFKNKLKEELYEGVTYEDIWRLTGVDENSVSFDKIHDTTSTYLMNAKNKLNALYGISVQHQFQQNIKYKDYGFDIDDNKELHWNKRELYIQGIYVTAHARFRLLLMALKISYDGMNLIYFDTDSIKCSGTVDTLNKCVDEWNRIVGNLRYKIVSIYKQKGENIFLSNFGNFDNEGCSDYFMTQGSKRYISIKGDKVKCTISGVNKKRTSQAMTLYYKRYGIENIYKEWFGLNTLYDYSLSLRSINFVPKEPMLIKDKIKDENGLYYLVNQYSCEGISEKDCGYLLAGFNHPLNPNVVWLSFCEMIQKRKINIDIEPHTISLTNMRLDDDGNLLDCNFKLEKGFTIEKYAEKLADKFDRYFETEKHQDFGDGLYNEFHDYRNGFGFIDS